MNQGAHTVQLFQALVTNETLTSVVFEFVAPDSTGAVKTFRRITLANAALSDLHERAGVAKPTWTTDVSVVFQKIEIQDVPSTVVATDSLLTAAGG